MDFKLSNMSAYVIGAKIWRYEGPSAWYFVTMPVEISEEIKEVFGKLSAGWGSLPVRVTIGNTTWKTSIFYDTKHQAYLLPIKADVRRIENLLEGNDVEVRIEVIG